jgi:hypothetical protein
MMRNGLVGLDVLNIAVHLTAAMLAGSHPDTPFDGECLLTMPYGAQKGEDVAIGSLDLLAESVQAGLIGQAAAQTAGGRAPEEVQDLVSRIGHGKFDLVIMNPPFTRPTNHEAGHASGSDSSVCCVRDDSGRAAGDVATGQSADAGGFFERQCGLGYALRGIGITERPSGGHDCARFATQRCGGQRVGKDPEGAQAPLRGLDHRHDRRRRVIRFLVLGRHGDSGVPAGWQRRKRRHADGKRPESDLRRAQVPAHLCD